MLILARQYFKGIGIIAISGMLSCTAANNDTSQVKAAVTREYLWPRQGQIPVCWENPSPELESGWTIMRQALEEEYNARTPIRFVDFGPCQAHSPGVRVLVSDTPNAARPGISEPDFMGPAVSGKKDALRQNFTFQNWRKDLCSDATKVRLCIRSYALHEFGHILGLQHEHQRADNICQPFGDTYRDLGDGYAVNWGTAYDPKSIMNYCMNAESLLAGEPPSLSRGDIEILERLYGAEKPLPDHLTNLDPGKLSLKQVDFRFLDELAQSKSHIALGEARHQSTFGTCGSSVVHETFFEAAKHLILHHRFEVVSLELPMTDMQKANNYVLGKTPLNDLKIGFSAFDTPELKAFLQWLEAYNRTQSADHKVQVAGFDVQHQAESDFKVIKDHLLDNGPQYSSLAAELDACPATPAAAPWDACEATLQNIVKILPSLAFETGKSRDFFELAVQSRLAELYVWSMDGLGGTLFKRGFEARDAAMALSYLHQATHLFPGKKIVSYGALFHMTKDATRIQSPLSPIENLGLHLARNLGDQYAVIGTLANVYTVQVQGIPLRASLQSKYAYEPGNLLGYLNGFDRFMMYAAVHKAPKLDIHAKASKIIFPHNVAHPYLNLDELATSVEKDYMTFVPREQVDGIFYFHKDGPGICQ
ncbi:MAG TPA: erythromycin esterase family protein [Oligoflexus sp.]|uniref:erythromycin esterase family protein n=1 Tax=Oligoflexus sp. TaxID=1971216 RepID=UPI002D2259E2|nr:erythromycin esterase family protein [Oligoflexus sp.]HYX37105.1 erythromycin esterase family protein [Oligoflexus sp.]